MWWKVNIKRLEICNVLMYSFKSTQYVMPEYKILRHKIIRTLQYLDEIYLHTCDIMLECVM